MSDQSEILEDIKHLADKSCTDEAIMSCDSLLSVVAIQVSASEEEAITPDAVKEFLRSVVAQNLHNVTVKAATKLIGLDSPGKGKGRRQGDAAKELGLAPRTMRHQWHQDRLTSALAEAIMKYSHHLAELSAEDDSDDDDRWMSHDALRYIVEPVPFPLGWTYLESTISRSPHSDELGWREQLRDHLNILAATQNLRVDLENAVSTMKKDPQLWRHDALKFSSVVRADFNLLHLTIQRFVLRNGKFQIWNQPQSEVGLCSVVKDIYYNSILPRGVDLAWLDALPTRKVTEYSIPEMANADIDRWHMLISACDCEPGSPSSLCSAHRLIKGCESYGRGLQILLREHFFSE